MSTVLFKSGNVYVIIKDADIDISNTQKDIIIDDSNYNGRQTTSLYGGRVFIDGPDSDGWLMCIDGISIQSFGYFDNNFRPSVGNYLAPEQVAAYLNQIENLGVDSFFINYKNQVLEFKKECEAMIEEIKRDLDANYNEKKEAHLSSLRSFVMNLACMLIMLMINMNAGLDNHCYTTAYDKIINLYF